MLKISFTRCVISLGLLSCLAAVGCQKTPSINTREEQSAVRVEQGDMFPGDLKLLEPHLGFETSGCLNIDTGNEEIWLTMWPEVWEKGKRINDTEPGSERVSGKQKITISVRPVCPTKGRQQFLLTIGVTGQRHSSASHRTINGPTESLSGRQTGRTDTHTLSGSTILDEGKPVSAWCWAKVLVDKANGPIGESLEEEAKRAQWALVLVLKRDDAQKDK